LQGTVRREGRRADRRRGDKSGDDWRVFTNFRCAMKNKENCKEPVKEAIKGGPTIRPNYGTW